MSFDIFTSCAAKKNAEKFTVQLRPLQKVKTPTRIREHCTEFKTGIKITQQMGHEIEDLSVMLAYRD